MKIFENLAGVDRQFTTQLDQKLLTAAATSQNGNATVSQGKSSTITSELLVQVENKVTTAERDDVERISKTNGSASLAVNVQEVDYPTEDLEQQMWMDRVNDSARGSTSSSSGSNVHSPARLAKPSKPAPASVEKKGFIVGTDVTGSQRYPWQSSAVGDLDNEDTTQLYSQETDAESDLERALAKTRKQLAAGDIGAAHATLQKVSPFMRT